MARGLARVLGIASLLGVGCDNALTVHANAGAILQMSWAVSTATPTGQHLELWARDGHDAIVRVDSSYTFDDVCDKRKTKTLYTFGLEIRPAITFDDPCLIDSKGNLLTTAAAYPGNVTIKGVLQTPEQQAQQVLNRIAQVTATAIGGRQTTTLLAVVPADETPPPPIAVDADAATRLAACRQYWCQSPLSYTPNPAQLTAPIHGAAYGFVSYTTTSPPAGFDGIRLDSPTKLGGIQELWLTVESVPAATVDPNNRGPVFLQGTPTMGGAGVVHFNLTGPTASGTAAVLVNLDDDSVAF